jgi:hypothetical protein
MITNTLIPLFDRSHKNAEHTAPDLRITIHFLHIGKCAGNQVGNVAEFINTVSFEKSGQAWPRCRAAAA